MTKRSTPLDDMINKIEIESRRVNPKIIKIVVDKLTDNTKNPEPSFDRYQESDYNACDYQINRKELHRISQKIESLENKCREAAANGQPHRVGGLLGNLKYQHESYSTLVRANANKAPCGFCVACGLSKTEPYEGVMGASELLESLIDIVGLGESNGTNTTGSAEGRTETGGGAQQGGVRPGPVDREDAERKRKRRARTGGKKPGRTRANAQSRPGGKGPRTRAKGKNRGA